MSSLQISDLILTLTPTLTMLLLLSLEDGLNVPDDT